MFCGHCGVQQSDDVKFCGSCGKAVLRTPPPLSEDAKASTTSVSNPSSEYPASDVSTPRSVMKPETTAAAIPSVAQSPPGPKSKRSGESTGVDQPRLKSATALITAAGIVVAGLTGLAIYFATRTRTAQLAPVAAATQLIVNPAPVVSSVGRPSAVESQSVVGAVEPPTTASATGMDCFDISKHEPHSLEGKLISAIFPDLPNFTDVRKGDDPVAGYILLLHESICIQSEDSEDSLDPTVRISEVQVVPADFDLNIDAAMRSLLGLVVRVDLAAAQPASTPHHYRPLVGWVSAITPQDQRVTETLIRRRLSAVSYSASQAAETGTAATTVRAFYYALGQGNGEGASQFIIPEKRQSSAYSPENLDRFFGPLPEPVRLLQLEAQATNEYLVRYAFGTGTRRCENRAVVTTTLRDELNLIEKIRQLEDCGAPASNEKSNATAAAHGPSNRTNDASRSHRESRPANMVVTQTPVSMDPRHPLKIGEEWYPDDSKRANEEGRCVVEVTVAADGRVATETVQRSSGFPRLDQACLKAVHDQRMFPATENGMPIQATVSIPIVWKLTNK